MASLKDKIKSKIKSRNQPETMQCFDETSLNINLIQGKYHLTELKIHCVWTNNKYNVKTPKLKCRWYNRTQKNYEQITGIEEQSYQPTILDIGSIIQVTCIPEIPGVSYQGMPILLKSQPIALSPETEAEANRLQSTGKSKLLVNIKQGKINGVSVTSGNDAMLFIDSGKLTLSLLKFGQINDQILKCIEINELFPEVRINRRISKQVTLKFNEEQSCTIHFKNHQIRDSFYLFHKLYLAKKSFGPQKENQITEENISSARYSSENVQKQQNQNSSQIQKKESIKIESQSNKSIKQHKHGQFSIKPGSSTDILQLMNLKEEIKRAENQNAKISKQLQHEKEKVFNLQNKVLQTNQRLENSSRNYFTLEKELQNVRAQNSKYFQIQNSKKQELIYYKNQIKVITDDRNIISKQLTTLRQNYDNILKQLTHYREMYNNKGHETSYQQLLQDLKQTKEINQELKLKNQYEIGQKQKLQDTLKNSRNLIQMMESEKKHIEKKYQSLTNQLGSPSLSPSMSSKRSDRSNQNNLSNSFIIQEIPILDKRESFKMINIQNDPRQQEILQLKKQLKVYIDQNNYLRSLMTKQKKPSNKTQLKMDLIEAKKIVSRLSEAVAEKDMALQNLKQINKDLNRRNEQLDLEYQQLIKQLKKQ